MMRVFEKLSVFPTTMEKIVEYHSHPEAMNYLTPLLIAVRPTYDKRKSFKEGEYDFSVWIAHIHIRWVARIEPGPTPTSFTDRMIEGPMELWEHQHLFRDVPGGVELTDRITFAHKPGLQGGLTRIAFDGWRLQFLFFCRHWRTRLMTKS
jgi:ligand-binding SRPBCC domain-containing protein